MRSRSLFLLACGCKDSHAVSVPVPVSVSASDTSDKSAATTTTTTTSKEPPSSAATVTTGSTRTAAAVSPLFHEEEEDTTSFSGLLRELGELERDVMELGPPAAGRRHRRCRSESGGRVEESVAVVKESEDPLGDFRRSMLQMIVEKEIVGGEELRELLGRFLRLNSPRHHDAILRAFAEIWSEVFAGYEDMPDLLRRSRSTCYHRRRRR